MTALAAGGCGGHTLTPQALALERGDFVAVARALARIEPAVRAEVAATKLAWPSVVNGLHTPLAAGARAAIETASARADAVGTPGLFEEHPAASLTGPGAPAASAFRSFSLLATRGWRLIAAAIEQEEHGPAVAARFAHANVGLYIESVYDGHFALAQVGKKLLAGYRNLGGARSFGAALTEREIEALSEVYSEASDRLHPHTGIRFGS